MSVNNHFIYYICLLYIMNTFLYSKCCFSDLLIRKERKLEDFVNIIDDND